MINIGNSGDKLERQILGLLDVSGRISASEIARKVRRGRDTVAYRLRTLEEKGILRGSEPIVDPSVFGEGLYKTYLRFHQFGKSTDTITNTLRKHPRMYCRAQAHGRWDLIFNCVARSPAEFAQIRREIIGNQDTSISEIGFAVITLMSHFSRKYLPGTPMEWASLQSTDRPFDFDEESRAVLRGLRINARLGDMELARLLGLSPVVVKHRREKLESSGIIKGYRARFDREYFGLSSYKLHVGLRDLQEKTYADLQRFAREHQFVTQYMCQLGAWSCELNVEAFDARHLAQIIDELRTRFEERLSHVEVSLYDKDEFGWGIQGVRNAQPRVMTSAEGSAL